MAEYVEPEDQDDHDLAETVAFHTARASERLQAATDFATGAKATPAARNPDWPYIQEKLEQARDAAGRALEAADVLADREIDVRRVEAGIRDTGTQG